MLLGLRVEDRELLLQEDELPLWLGDALKELLPEEERDWLPLVVSVPEAEKLPVTLPHPVLLLLSVPLGEKLLL